MTGNKHKSPPIPTLHTYSSAYALKASYQRNMLVGLLCASLLVGVPAVVVAWWPVGEGPTSTGPPHDRSLNTVVIHLPLKQPIRVIPDQPPVKMRGNRPHVKGALGTFVDRVVPVPDQLELGDDQPAFRLGGDDDLMPGVDDWSGLWEGVVSDNFGIVFIPDTTVYEISSELDCIPELVAMEKPKYPPLAQKAGIEGEVILYVLVCSDGFVEEVTVFSESATGYGFGRYAAEAARTAVFVPALYNNQPVRCLVSFPVEFVLDE